MEKANKKQIKKYISWFCMVSVVAMLTAMPLLAKTSYTSDEPQASILSGTVENGSITVSLFGGGTLTSETAVDVTLPAGVKISEFYVSNGDRVSLGDPLAKIDRVSVMSAITQVQDTMDHLLEEMEELSSQNSTVQLSAVAGGHVKQVFAEKGDDVQDVMLEHGALAVLSLDGLLAVRIEQNSSLVTGDPVTIVMEDDVQVPGRVDSNMEGVLVVTVEDDGYTVGASVTVTDPEGNRIGSGPLYVHNGWKAVAYSGTVSSVNIREEDTAYAGQTIFSLDTNDQNPQLESLAVQHRKYEGMMLKLFQLYQAEAVTAPCDGTVSGVDANSIHLLSGSNDGFSLKLLANAPGADADAQYDNHVGQITGMLGSQWLVTLDPESQEITDYKADMEDIDIAPENRTTQTMMEMVTVYKLVEDQWEITTPNPGDILLFAMDDEGFVWAVYIDHKDLDLPEPSEPSEPTDPTEDPDLDEIPDDSTTEPEEEPETEPTEDPDDIPDLTFPDFGLIGGFGGGTIPEEEFPMFSLDESVLMAVIPQNEMTLNIQISELDIQKVHVGMTAEVTVEALQKQTFPAVITDIGDTGTSRGGSSQFTVTLTMEIQEDMLDGMSATAVMPLHTTENILLIPAEALVEIGARTFVYTGFDEETEELINPIEVTLGESDGKYAEVLSGLSAGDTYWYSYYDTLQIDHTAKDFGFSFG